MEAKGGKSKRLWEKYVEKEKSKRLTTPSIIPAWLLFGFTNCRYIIEDGLGGDE